MSKVDTRQVFVFNTDWDYFKTVTHEEGGEVLQFVRDESGSLIKSWQPGDLAFVWINQKKRVAAFYTIKKVSEREDQIATIESFDESSDRPHRVVLNNDQTSVTTLDLRRKSYLVYHRDSQKRVPAKLLSSPITSPLQVRIRWMLWKYSVLGGDIHFVSTGFELKEPTVKDWYRQIVGPERKSILEQADNGENW